MYTELRNNSGSIYLTVEYDEVNKWVYNNWIGYQNYPGIKAGMAASIGLLRKHNCCCMLNDNRQVVGEWDDAVEWITEDVLPRAAAYGLVHFAHIVTPESMAAYTAEMLYISIESEVNIRIFHDLEQAQNWLRSTYRDNADRDTAKLLRSLRNLPPTEQ